MLSQTQELLLDGLRAFGVEKDLIIGIMIMLPKEDQQYELMYWMANHAEAKPEDILLKATEIIA